MSEEKKLSDDALTKALDEIKKIAGGGEDLVKGHSSRGTATTAVDSMSGEGGSTQVHHTGSDSDPGTWAGTGQRPAGENGAKDAVDENGTDYNGGAEMAKAVLALVAAGRLSVDDAASVLAKGKPPFMEKDDDKDDDVEKAVPACDDDEEDMKKMGKSLAEAAQDNAKLSEGFEVSDFLSEMTTEISKALEGAKAELKAHIDSRLAKSEGAQEEFNKSLAGSLSNFAEVVAVQGQRIGQVEQSPARAPKSATNVQALNKSFEAGAPEGEQFSKSQLLTGMTDMVMKGKLSADKVLKLDSTDQIDSQTYAAVVAHISGN